MEITSEELQALRDEYEADMRDEQIRDKENR